MADVIVLGDDFKALPRKWKDMGDGTWAEVVSGGTGGGGSDTQANIIADVSVPDGTTDNTSYLQGLLTTAIAAGKTLRIPKGTGGSWVISHLIIANGALVDATGATFVQPGTTNTRMIYNTSLTLGTPGSARDSKISWTGGTFVKGTNQTNIGNAGLVGTGLDDHCIMFGFVDGLIVKNVTVNQSGTGGNAGTGGRYGCFVYNCTNFYFENYAAVSASLSVNQSTLQIAYSQQGHVKGVYGSFGDDMVAIVNGNNVADLLTNGAAVSENITIEDVFGTSPSTGVKLMPGSTTANTAPFYNVQRCRVLNVRGSFGSRGGTAAIFCGGSATYATLQGGSLLDCEIQNVTQLQATTAAVYVTVCAESHGLVLRGCNNLGDAPAVLIDVTGSSAHSSVKVADADYTTAITSGSYYPISCTNSTLRTLILENLRLNAATTGTATVGLVNAASAPGWLVASGCRGTGKVLLLGTIATTCRISARGCEQEDANGLGWFNTVTGAVVTVCEWANNFFGGLNTITQTAGTVGVKNGASSLPGASGTVALVAGTATVTPGSGMCSTTSQIRLTNLATGGTVGAVAVSARGATTFTILSTSGADTSTILWEIINS